MPCDGMACDGAGRWRTPRFLGILFGRVMPGVTQSVTKSVMPGVTQSVTRSVMSGVMQSVMPGVTQSVMPGVTRSVMLGVTLSVSLGKYEPRDVWYTPAMPACCWLLWHGALWHWACFLLRVPVCFCARAPAFCLCACPRFVGCYRLCVRGPLQDFFFRVHRGRQAGLLCMRLLPFSSLKPTVV